MSFRAADHLNATIAAIPPSGIRKFFDIVAEMKDAISLGVGEPDFDTPWSVCQAGVRSIERGETHYTSNWGIPELRRQIARYQEDRMGVPYSPTDEVLVTVGASEGIDLALRAIVSPGDEVLLPTPSYVSYLPCIAFAGGVPVFLPLSADNAFRLTPEMLKAAITPKTKALLLPFPSNPTGGIMDKADLEAIAEVLRGTNILIVSDEIYAELTYGDTPHVSIASLPGMRERTVVLNGFSKAFAMTGWRLGYACAPREIMELMVKIHQYVIMCAPTTAQAAGTEALRSAFDSDFRTVRRMRDIYDQRRRTIVSGLNDIGLSCFEPLGAFYAFPNITATGLSSEAFAEGLLREEKVAVVPGTAFGTRGEGFVRCSYATATEKIGIALERIERFVRRRMEG